MAARAFTRPRVSRVLLLEPNGSSRRISAATSIGPSLPEQSYVLGDTGIAPYLSHASVIDALCLNSADLTRPPISFDRGRFLDSVFAHSPDLVVIHAWSPQRLAPVHDERGFYEALAADPRFLARYQLQKRAPVFHSRYPGEGFFYTIYERRPCGDPGQACCANTKCAGGCCVAGTCVASGSSCGSSIGSCNGGVCEAGSAPHDFDLPGRSPVPPRAWRARPSRSGPVRDGRSVGSARLAASARPWSPAGSGSRSLGIWTRLHQEAASRFRSGSGAPLAL